MAFIQGVGSFAMQNTYADKSADMRLMGLLLGKREIDQAKAEYDPYKEFGLRNVEEANRLFEDPSYIAQMPGYQFGLDQGLKGTTNLRSKTSIFSGETLMALTEYASNYALKAYDSEWKRLFGGMEVGMTATNKTSELAIANAELFAAMGESQAREYDQKSAILAGEQSFGRQIFGQWSGAFAGASASATGSGMG